MAYTRSCNEETYYMNHWRFSGGPDADTDLPSNDLLFLPGVFCLHKTNSQLELHAANTGSIKEPYR